jgi:hypothetical protein
LLIFLSSSLAVIVFIGLFRDSFPINALLLVISNVILSIPTLSTGITFNASPETSYSQKLAAAAPRANTAYCATDGYIGNVYLLGPKEWTSLSPAGSGVSWMANRLKEVLIL